MVSHASGEGLGGFLRVKAVVLEDARQDTYNFEVADTHTYFVGQLNAWVHNACDPGDLLANGGGYLGGDGTTIIGVYGNKFTRLPDGTFEKVGPATAEEIATAKVVVEVPPTSLDFHETGYRIDFYDISGNPIKWLNPEKNQIEDIPLDIKFHKDHILPKHEIRRMAVTAGLKDGQIKVLLNDPKNFQPLEQSLNCSKGCRINGTDNPWDTYKGNPIRDDYRAWLENEQDLLRQHFLNQITEMKQ